MKGLAVAAAVGALALLFCIPSGAERRRRDRPFRDTVPVGLGGGGGLFAPASSPHDPDLMFVSCDMGGFYRSTDGGRHWRMIDFRQTRGSTECRPVFHPRDPKTVYFKDLVSRDGGLTWRPLFEKPPWKKVVELAVDCDDGGVLYVGAPDGLYATFDGGHWRQSERVPFAAINRVCFHPAEKDLVYVTTFGGGVFKMKTR